MTAGHHGRDRAGRWLAIAASVAVVAAVIAAIWVMGTPSAQREAKLDSRRIDDLNHIVKLRYRLCAVFATNTAKTPVAGGPWNPDDWNHGVGRHCFERKAKPADPR